MHEPSQLEKLQAFTKGTLVENLGITFMEIDDKHLKASMPVDHRTIQPFGLLHGGASVALAETLGSVAAQQQAGPDKICVGVEINANHLKMARDGEMVFGVTKPVRIGYNIQVWNIEITNENNELICVSRITVAVRDKN